MTTGPRPHRLATTADGESLISRAGASLLVVAPSMACLTDAGAARARPPLLGPPGSDPTVFRLVAKLATDAPAASSASTRS